MGKTALFQHVVETHFRDQKTAFSAFAKWGCLVVPFAARDFADGSEDRQEPDWVINAVRATLSRRGITFSDDRMLLRILETGTIGVAIDGLNEAGRTRAVSSFCSRFGSTPMLVTSQYPGDHPFQTWRLPDDAGGFIEALLSLHLGEDSAAIVLDRIMKSRLADSKLSGYDIRLIIDLARTDPTAAALPSNRMELYREVVDRGWPLNGPERQAEEQRRTAAAAWRMVSERRPNEDMRRLKPDVDLAAELLAELADAPEKYHRPVRLIRRTTGAFEFVHDQMHSFLAATWLTQDGFSVVEITRMLQESTIWTQSTDARKTLWGFVAPLLDSERLLALWRRIEELDDWDALRRALKAEAELRKV